MSRRASGSTRDGMVTSRVNFGSRKVPVLPASRNDSFDFPRRVNTDESFETFKDKCFRREDYQLHNGFEFEFEDQASLIDTRLPLAGLATWSVSPRLPQLVSIDFQSTSSKTIAMKSSQVEAMEHLLAPHLWHTYPCGLRNCQKSSV